MYMCIYITIFISSCCIYIHISLCIYMYIYLWSAVLSFLCALRWAPKRTLRAIIYKYSCNSRLTVSFRVFVFWHCRILHATIMLFVHIFSSPHIFLYPSLPPTKWWRMHSAFLGPPLSLPVRLSFLPSLGCAAQK